MNNNILINYYLIHVCTYSVWVCAIYYVEDCVNFVIYGIYFKCVFLKTMGMEHNIMLYEVLHHSDNRDVISDSFRQRNWLDRFKSRRQWIMSN